jgi:phosphopantothenoylcysteine synthetase/decarboxylase
MTKAKIAVLAELEHAPKRVGAIEALSHMARQNKYRMLQNMWFEGLIKKVYSNPDTYAVNDDNSHDLDVVNDDTNQDLDVVNDDTNQDLDVVNDDTNQDLDPINDDTLDKLRALETSRIIVVVEQFPQLTANARVVLNERGKGHVLDIE